MTIDWIMKTTTDDKKTGIQWTLWTQLEDLDFADDLALLSHTHKQMKAKTDELVRVSQTLGLKVHPDKSQILKINCSSKEDIEVSGTCLQNVDTFTYLGSIIDKQGGTEADVKSRIGKARKAFAQLRNVWKSGILGRNIKLRIFNTNVKSVLLYGSETWRLTKGTIHKLQTFINNCLRRIVKVHYPETIRNEELWKTTGQKRIEVEIKQRRWRWIGHTMRKPCSNITNYSRKWNPQGKRKRGRPRSSWKRDLESEMKEMGTSCAEVTALAQDRSGWRVFVVVLYSNVGY